MAMMNLHCKSPLLLVVLQSEFQFSENNSHIFSIKMQFSTENKTKTKLDLRLRKDKSFSVGTSKDRGVVWKSVVKCAGKHSVGYQFTVTSSQRGYHSSEQVKPQRAFSPKVIPKNSKQERIQIFKLKEEDAFGQELKPIQDLGNGACVCGQGRALLLLLLLLLLSVLFKKFAARKVSLAIAMTICN